MLFGTFSAAIAANEIQAPLTRILLLPTAAQLQDPLAFAADLIGTAALFAIVWGGLLAAAVLS